jgi:hypothetical protein
MTAFAHEAVIFMSDFWNSFAVLSPKNATSIYPTFDKIQVNIFSCVDGITIVSRVTSIVFGGFHSPLIYVICTFDHFGHRIFLTASSDFTPIIESDPISVMISPS